MLELLFFFLTRRRLTPGGLHNLTSLEQRETAKFFGRSTYIDSKLSRKEENSYALFSLGARGKKWLKSNEKV